MSDVSFYRRRRRTWSRDVCLPRDVRITNRGSDICGGGACRVSIQKKPPTTPTSCYGYVVNCAYEIYGRRLSPDIPLYYIVLVLVCGSHRQGWDARGLSSTSRTARGQKIMASALASMLYPSHHSTVISVVSVMNLYFITAARV